MRNVLILLIGMTLIAADPGGPKPLTEVQQLKIENWNLKFQQLGCQAILNDQQVFVSQVCKEVGADNLHCRIDNTKNPWTVEKFSPPTTPAPKLPEPPEAKPVEKK